MAFSHSIYGQTPHDVFCLRQMKTFFKPIQLPDDQDPLVAFLTSEEWPFHVNLRLSTEKVLSMINDGIFDGSNHESFWILDDERNKVGFIRLFDLDDIEDGYPLFDIRIRERYRGFGIGKNSVQWLTKYLFVKHLNLERIVGTTRVDNSAMRKIFKSCGYVKEGHYRKDWSSSNGRSFDTVKYGILREDWMSGTITPVPWNDEP
jgi:RimJ/RimL family protein N-acetyltransferase